MQYTHEHLEIQNTLKRFIDAEINPHVDEWEEAEIFPAHALFKKLGNLGLLGLTKPEAYGGAGLDYSYAMAMAEGLGRDPQVESILRGKKLELGLEKVREVAGVSMGDVLVRSLSLGRSMGMGR